MTDETTAPEGAATAAAPEKEATETSAPQNSVNATADTPEQAEAKKSKGVQKRIDELTAHWRNEQRRAERLEEMLAGLVAPKTAEAPAAPQGKPTLEQFEYDQERYLDALADWKLSEREKAAEAKRKEAEAKESAAKRTKTFAEREAAYAAEREDYITLARDPTLPVSEPMAQAILEAEEGPAILYYLGQHRDEAAQIAQMTPYAASVAMGKIAARLTAPPPKPEPEISAAPPPAPTVKPTAPAPKGLSDELSVKDWLRERNKQLAKKRA